MAFSLSISAAWPVLALLVYHIRVELIHLNHRIEGSLTIPTLYSALIKLILLNITTIEQVRSKAHAIVAPGEAPRNPFSFGSWKRNASWVFCHPAGYSWIEPSAFAEEDARVINPGSLPGWRYGEKEVDEMNETDETNVDGNSPREDA